MEERGGEVRLRKWGREGGEKWPLGEGGRFFGGRGGRWGLGGGVGGDGAVRNG